jgi:hypothetical protein
MIIMGWDTYICIEEYTGEENFDNVDAYWDEYYKDENWVCIQTRLDGKSPFWASGTHPSNMFNIEWFDDGRRLKPINKNHSYPEEFKKCFWMLDDCPNKCGVIYIAHKIRISFLSVS